MDLNFNRIVRSFGVAAFLSMTTVVNSYAVSNVSFISAPNRVDIAYDNNRNLLYISGDQYVQRYDLSNRTFLSPIALGGTTGGMDISPDGSTLAVANFNRGATKNFVDLVNLDTLASKRVGFNLASYEGGTYTTAYDRSGSLLVSSLFEGSGWVPLRKYDPATNTTTILGSVNQSTMLAASLDRSTIAIAESNSSNGPWGTYHTGDTSYSSAHAADAFLFEIGISPDASQIAIPTYFGTLIDDSTKILPSIGTYAGDLPIGVAYDPTANLVLFPFSGTSSVFSYDTNTGLQVGEYNIGIPFDWVGNGAFQDGRIKFANDGKEFFVTVNGGVAVVPTSPVPIPNPIAFFVSAIPILLFRVRRTN